MRTITKIALAFIFSTAVIASGCGTAQNLHGIQNRPVAAYQIDYNAVTNVMNIKSIDVTPSQPGVTQTTKAGVFQSGNTVLSGMLITAPVYITNNDTKPWTGVEMQAYELLSGSAIVSNPDKGTGWFTNSPPYGAWGWLFTSGTSGSEFTIPAGGRSVARSIGFSALSNFAGWVYIYADVPVITGISPLGALAGQPITISGFNFSTTQDTITFNGVPATVTSWSPTSIVATVPTNVTLGNIIVNTVYVNTPYSNGVIFTPYRIFAPSVRNPFGITVDTMGNLYVASNSTNYIKLITPSGAVSNYSTNGSRSALNSPMDVAMDPTGNGLLYVPSYNNNDIVTVDTSGRATPFATGGMNGPDALYFSRAGQSWPLFVANGGNGTISEVASNGTVTRFASGFTQPTALTVDASGNVYVGECSNGTVYEVNAAGTMTTTVVTGLVCPTCMKQDASGDIYILDDTTTSTMYKYDPTTGITSFYVSGNGILDANGGFAFSPDFSLLYVGQTQPINDVTVIPLK